MFSAFIEHTDKQSPYYAITISPESMHGIRASPSEQYQQKRETIKGHFTMAYYWYISLYAGGAKGYLLGSGLLLHVSL